MAELPFWAAVRSVRDGMSGSAGLRAYRAGGGSIRTQTWFQMIGEAQAAIAGRGAEIGRPLDSRPRAGEFTRFTTRGATGVIQQVEVAVRDRGTGLVSMVPFSVKGDRTITRGEAIDVALDHIEGATANYGDQVVLGAMYTGTYRLVPEGSL